MGTPFWVNRTMGQEGPRTEEKWSMRGTRLGRGRVSTIAATLVVMLRDCRCASLWPI